MLTSLRLRLIVAFFLLSVVPLAAVTFYNHSSNLAAVREAAANEAEMLADELTQRMQVVTAQLGQRVERLIAISGQGEEVPASPTPAAAQTAAAAAVNAAAAATSSSTAEAELATRAVSDTLGDLAMLLNNVEIRGIRGRGGRGGGRGGGGGRRGGPPPSPVPPPAPGAPVPPGAPAPASSPGGTTGGQAAVAQGSQAPTNPSVASSPGQPVVSADPSGGRRGFGQGDRGAGPRFGGDRGGPPPGFDPNGRGNPRDGRPPGPDGGFPPRGGGPPPQLEPDLDPTRIRIDMAPVWREVMQQFVPDGEWEKLPPEDRQRIFAEVNQRMLGIQQGIQMLQARVAERVADVQAQTAAAAATSTPSARSGAPANASSPATTSASARPTAVPVAPARRTTAIEGGQLAVRMMRDGEVVSEASAEINLPNLLSAVFTTTKRERGEVPFAVAADGRLYAPTESDRRMVESIGTDAVRADVPAGTRVTGDWTVVTTTDPTGSGLKFGIARPLGEAVADLRRRTAVNAGFGLGLIVLALVGIVPLSSRLTRNLQRLSEGVSRISQGDYRARVDVRSHDEVGRLATAFNVMAGDIEAHQRTVVERERLRRELELGRQIQHDMLPQTPLVLGLTEIKGVSVPAREVGGDFFNYFQLGNGTVALIVGDVSGKGVGAALLMANLQASLRTRLSLGQDLASLARELDVDIEASTPGPVYATLFVGIFDPATRLLRAVNAGHNPQYVIRRGGKLERMEASGLPIGLLAGRGYAEQRVQLEAGDLLFFYTDGGVEAENKSGDMFGMDRLETALSASESADDVMAAVETEITRFRAGVELADDATMMVVKVG